jgi:hypothetical protein
MSFKKVVIAQSRKSRAENRRGPHSEAPFSTLRIFFKKLKIIQSRKKSCAFFQLNFVFMKGRFRNEKFDLKLCVGLKTSANFNLVVLIAHLTLWRECGLVGKSSLRTFQRTAFCCCSWPTWPLRLTRTTPLISRKQRAGLAVSGRILLKRGRNVQHIVALRITV